VPVNVNGILGDQKQTPISYFLVCEVRAGRPLCLAPKLSRRINVSVCVSVPPLFRPHRWGALPTGIAAETCREKRPMADAAVDARCPAAARGLPQPNRGSPADKAARCRHDGRESLAQATAPAWAARAVSTAHACTTAAQHDARRRTGSGRRACTARRPGRVTPSGCSSGRVSTAL
jgi:hypothetical protein